MVQMTEGFACPSKVENSGSCVAFDQMAGVGNSGIPDEDGSDDAVICDYEEERARVATISCAANPKDYTS